MRNATFKRALFVNTALVALAGVAFAQDGASDTEETDDIIIVTGTAKGRSSFESPQSVNAYPEKDIRKFTSSSQADLLTQLPGVAAEGGGGEVATNFFVRGLPSGGQFQFTPLEYDGIPVFSTFGLNSSAFDVYYRNDLGIERLEYVTGGVSNLFGPGSVAGIINYISKTGGPEAEGTLQLELAEEGRVRADVYQSGPLGGPNSDTFYAFSGYYRQDEGPLTSGLDTEGYQVRGNIKHEFADGTGDFTLYGQAIDDKVQFFLPLPLDGVSRERATGNDGKEVFTLNTAQAGQLSYDLPDGRFETPIEDGVVTEGYSLAFALNKDLNDEWTLNAKGKYAKYNHQFNLFLDGDGLTNLPLTTDDYLTALGFGGVGTASATFIDTGEAVPSNFLLFGNRTLDRVRDADDVSGEVNVSRSFDWGNAEHTVTFGGYYSNTEAKDLNYITTYVTDFRNEPRLVDITIDGATQDANGDLIAAAPGTSFAVTRNGLLRSNGVVGDRVREAKRSAFYVADQIEAGRWAFDIGARLEDIEGQVLQREISSVQMSNDPQVSDLIESVGFQNGDSRIGNVSDTEWAASASVLYRLNDVVNLFGNYSRGFFFPEVRSVRFIFDTNQTGPYKAEIIKTAEAGAKIDTGQFSGYVTGFWTTLDDRQSVDFVNDGNGGITNVVTQQSTKAYGVEAGGVYSITDNLSVNGNVTLRDHEFTGDVNNGNELRRQPKVIVNTGLTYDDGKFDFSIFHNYHGDNFANDSNTVKLDSYNLVRLDAGYTHEFANDQSVRFSVNVFNLFDEQGVTEGSPRQGDAQTGGQDFFVGRPILPQRVMVRATYDF